MRRTGAGEDARSEQVAEASGKGRRPLWPFLLLVLRLCPHPDARCLGLEMAGSEVLPLLVEQRLGGAGYFVHGSARDSDPRG